MTNDGASPPFSSVLVVSLFMWAPWAGENLLIIHSWLTHLLHPAWLLQAGSATVQAASLERVLGKDELAFHHAFVLFLFLHGLCSQGASTRMCHLFQFGGCLQEGVHHAPKAQPSDEAALGGCLVAYALDHQACHGCKVLPAGGAHTNDNARA